MVNARLACTESKFSITEPQALADAGQRYCNGPTPISRNFV
jgi:hypothetical protein